VHFAILPIRGTFQSSSGGGGDIKRHIKHFCALWWLIMGTIVGEPA